MKTIKPMQYKDAVAWTRRRVQDTVAQGSFPKDIVAMIALAVEAHKAQGLREHEQWIQQLQDVINTKGRITREDWMTIVSTPGSTITVD